MKKERGKKKIYEYCDENIGEKILLTGFMSLYSQLEHEISPQDVVRSVSGIVNNLIQKRVLKEVSKEFESIYGRYEILSHERLLGEK